MDSKSIQPQFHYPATLDPWLRHSDTDIARLLKLIALTSPHVVLYDNQAINNSGLQRLLEREDVKHFLKTEDPATGHLPIVIALRAGALDFEDVLYQLVVDRDRPAILPWMNSNQQERLEIAYSGGRGRTLGPLYDIAGKHFVSHINFLNSLMTHRYSGLISWKGLQERYPELVSNSINRFIRGVKHLESDAASQKSMLKLCHDLLSFLDTSSEVNRSNLYRIILNSTAEDDVKSELELKLLTEPYHNNIAQVCNFHQITGPEYQRSPFPRIFPKIAKAFRSLRPIETHELNQFPVQLDQVAFSRITQIRHSPSFHTLLQHIYDPDEPRPAHLRDFLNLIQAEVAREPIGLSKLGRVRIHLLVTPRQLRDDLLEAGITLADLLGGASRGLGFLVGEVVGQIVGVFAVGGLLGASAALVVEQIAEKRYLEPNRRRDFQQLVQLLRKPSAINHMNNRATRASIPGQQIMEFES